ncbi:glycoside hydrolase family 3 protein [Flindersiella endophytica]
MNRRIRFTAWIFATMAVLAFAAPASGSPPNSRHGWVETALGRMSLEQKVGQLFVAFVFGADANTPTEADRAQNQFYFGLDTAAEVVRRYHLGGVAYFTWANNLRTPSQTATLSNDLQAASLDASGVPLTIATDEEQGVVHRLPPAATHFPGAMALGATRRPADAAQAAAVTGAEMRAMGIQLAYAPVGDVFLNRINPVTGVRAYSSDPGLAARMTAAQVAGFQDGADTGATVKTFPGHGATNEDSHAVLPVVNHSRAEWERLDAPPFRAAIAAGADAVMSAHVVFPALDESRLPATLSRPILTGLLRNRLGFDGLIVTDALNMPGLRDQYPDDLAPVLALQAGADVLLMPQDLDTAYNAVLTAVRNGDLTEQRIDQSVRRILAWKAKRSLDTSPLVDPDRAGQVVGSASHQAVAARVADDSVTLVRDHQRALPLVPGRTLVAGYTTSTTNPLPTLATRLQTRGATTTTMPTGSQPSDAQIAAAVAAAADQDAVVVLTNKAWDQRLTDPGRRQGQLVEALLATGKPVIVVAIREPYDLEAFPTAPTYLATYASVPATMESVARVLYGELAARGTLPVELNLN